MLSGVYADFPNTPHAKLQNFQVIIGKLVIYKNIMFKVQSADKFKSSKHS